MPNTNRFYEPQTKSGIINLRLGEPIELFCSVKFVAPFAGGTLFATCAVNNQFLVNGKAYSIKQMRCSGQTKHVARRTTHACGPRGLQTHIEVGFVVSPTRFLRTMDICHDEQTMSTMYAHYTQVAANAGFQRAFPRPSFKTGDFFGGRKVDKLYTKATQKSTIGRVLGDSRVATVFDDSSSLYLARGHLAAKVDFIFGAAQRSTFYFVNVAAQWQKINAANWESIESGTRAMVANRNLRTEIYTGTWEVLRMADVNGKEQPLYLDYEARTGRGLIAVPAMFYKVVIDVVSKKGIVFVCVNNPHATAKQVAAGGEYRLCSDVSHRIGWLNWDRTNVKRGYSYACDVNEFVAVVKDLPRTVRTAGLLV